MAAFINKYDQDYQLIKEIINHKKDYIIPLTLIVEKIVPNSKILEFGPATGYLTRYLKEELNCSITIIEIDPHAADIAGKFAERSIVCDIESYLWLESLQNELFDFIIFADVLEHLKNPWEALRKSSDLLKKKGVVFISIPNIGHNSIILDLWNNFFKYQETGILDNSHLRFFGINNIDDIFKNTGLTRFQMSLIDVDINNKRFEGKYNQIPFLLRFLLKRRKYPNVFQIVLSAKKTN